MNLWMGGTYFKIISKFRNMKNNYINMRSIFYNDEKLFDVIVSSECFEHDEFWELTIKKGIDLLKPDGIFLFTCATTGRPEHGTKRTSPSDSPFTSSLENDYYRNLEEKDIRQSINVDEIFSEYEFQSRLNWPQDLYFWGIKK